MREQFEYQRRRNLVGDVGNADIEEGKLYVQHIAADHFEVVGVRTCLHTLCDFRNHARVDFDRDHLFGLLQEGHCEVAGTWADF